MSDLHSHEINTEMPNLWSDLAIEKCDQLRSDIHWMRHARGEAMRRNNAPMVVQWDTSIAGANKELHRLMNVLLHDLNNSKVTA